MAGGRRRHRPRWRAASTPSPRVRRSRVRRQRQGTTDVLTGGGEARPRAGSERGLRAPEVHQGRQPGLRLHPFDRSGRQPARRVAPGPAQACREELDPGAERLRGRILPGRPRLAGPQQFPGGGGRVAVLEMGQRRGQRQPGVLLPSIRAEEREGPSQGREVPREQEPEAVASHQLARQPRVGGALGVAQGVGGLVAFGPPPRGDGVELPMPCRSVPGHVRRQVGAQQAVEPVLGGSDALDHGGAVHELVEDVRRVGPPGECHGERDRQTTADADVLQQRAARRRHGREHLAGEVVGDRPLVPVEAGQDRRRILAAAQGDRRQAQAAYPPLGAVVQHGHVRRAELDTRRRQQGCDVVAGEPELVGPELGEQALHAQARQRQRRVGAGREDQLRPPGVPPQQPAEHVEARPVPGQEVHVVEDQADRRMHGVERVEELVGGVRAVPLAAHVGERAPGGLDGRHDRRPQPPRVGVVGVEAHPGRRRPRVLAGPLREEHGLARPGGRDHRDEPRAARLVQPSPEPRPRDEPPRELGHRDLAGGDTNHRGRPPSRPLHGCWRADETASSPGDERGWSRPGAGPRLRRSEEGPHRSRPCWWAVRTASRRVPTPSFA